jgi:hypothetical protein
MGDLLAAPAVKVIVAWRLSGTTFVIVGASGSVGANNVTDCEFDIAVLSLSPSTTAIIFTAYSPYAKPVTTIGLTLDTGSRDVQVVPLSVEYL